DESAQFYPHVTDMGISEVELSLGLTLPLSLQDLLTTTNGVMNLMKLDKKTIETGWLIWPMKEIIKENLFFRSEANKLIYKQQFNDLLFFAAASADGILFAYKISEKRVAAPDIYVWHPREDTLNRIAPSLKIFIEQW